MATFGPRFGDDDFGTLSIQRIGARQVDVFFRPSATRLAIAKAKNLPAAGVRLLKFDADRKTTTLFPINTMPTSEDFFEPKHAPITSIEFVDRGDFTEDYELPANMEDINGYLDEGMPKGFTKDPNFGLGLDRKLSFILHTIGSVPGVSNLRFTHERLLEVALVDQGKTYEIGYRLFDQLRRDANRFDDKAQISSRKKKIQIAYSNLLTNLDRVNFPVKLIERSPDDVADAIGRTMTDNNLSDKDRSAVTKLAGASVRKTMKVERQAVVKLHDEIELASLEVLIEHVEGQLKAKSQEPRWQKLFETNPFILDMVFNVPVLLIQGQAHVGGKALSGAGEKIADFLFTNSLTDSLAILEIKTPSIELIGKKEYRGGVFAPSPELVGAVAQTLDQIDKLHSDIYRVKAMNPQHRLEGYGIKGVLLAGLIPEDDRKRAFELYRNSLSGITIVTFDELLAKLKSLHQLLSSKSS